VWRIPIDVQRRAMGIDWMTLQELSEAIPPSYSEHIGRAALIAIARAADKVTNIGGGKWCLRG